MEIINWIVENVLSQAAIFMGLIAAAGLLIQGKSGQEVIEGALMTAVGQIVFSTAAGIISEPIVNINSIIMPAFGVEAGVSPDGDRSFAVAQSIDFVATNAVPVFVVVWLLHLVLVRVFHKRFKAVFLTLHGMLNCVGCCLMFFYVFMGYRGLAVYIPTILICVAYFTISPMLGFKASMEITDGGFALAHADQIGTWLSTKIAPLFGDPEKDDADNLDLPGWLSMFSSMTLNLAITMPLVFIVIGIIVVIGGNAEAIAVMNELAGDTNPFVYFVIQGLTVAGGVVILMTGLRMYLGSIIPAFQGFSEKLLPDAVPAVDAAAFFGYSQMAQKSNRPPGTTPNISQIREKFVSD